LQAEIISIGEELLSGQTINTNAAFISEKLTEVGIPTRWIQTVGDKKKEILEALKIAQKRNEVVLITGGLGPTHDDITKQVATKFFKSKLVEDKIILKKVKSHFKKRKITMPKINQEQALIPHNCQVIDNISGTAPGMMFTQKKQIFIFMPGVPSEMQTMLTKAIIPFLKEKNKGTMIKNLIINTTGIAESVIYEKLNMAKLKDVEVAFLPELGGVKIKLTVSGKKEVVLDQKLAKAQTYILSKIKNCTYGNLSLEASLAQTLIKQNLSISVAESCTGGLIAHKITNVPGSSAYFKGGIVAYSNELKNKLLKVPQSLLKKHGAVSAEVVQVMAQNVAKITDADIGLAISGIAGPGGGTPEKPVGLAYISMYYKNKITVKKHHTNYDRVENKKRFAAAALGMIKENLGQ
jgi:nicotinamide-nucleotide amidase